MPNSFFRFKQFTVYQDKCALKVCTDACLFGAWTADIVNCQLSIANLKHPVPYKGGFPIDNKKLTIESILDVGTGTGLLSLMLAQQTTVPIDAVEVERPDFLQAADNFAQSAWSERLNPIWTDITNYRTAKQYDLIISNPPFYENDLLPENAGKQRAKHDSHLTLNALFTEVDRLLSGNGVFAVLLPFHRKQEALALAHQFSLVPVYITDVRQTPAHECFRSMFFLSRTASGLRTSEITIKENGVYTPAFTELLKDFYLYL